MATLRPTLRYAIAHCWAATPEPSPVRTPPIPTETKTRESGISAMRMTVPTVMSSGDAIFTETEVRKRTRSKGRKAMATSVAHITKALIVYEPLMRETGAAASIPAVCA